MMNPVHELLLAGALTPDEPVTLALTGVIALREQRLLAYQAPIVGLTEATFRRLLQRFFPNLDLVRAAAWLPLDVYPVYTPGVGDEFPDLLALLLEHRSVPGEKSHWLAQAVATACMGRNHLWQDLGLLHRGMLSVLMREQFTTLFLRNVGDMKWKKFFYKQLCEQAEMNLCRAPSCGVCNDYQHCFGYEPGQSLLAVPDKDKLWVLRDVSS
jgi:nitrogen fixation protein NifQ